MTVDEGNAQAERLGESNQCIVNRAVSVRVQLAHDFADDSGALDIALFRAESHLCHLIDDATLNGLQSVASVGQSARIDDGVGILEE